MCKHMLNNVIEQKQFAASQLNVELKSQIGFRNPLNMKSTPKQYTGVHTLP